MALSEEDKQWIDQSIYRAENTILRELNRGQMRERALEARLNAIEERLHYLEQK